VETTTTETSIERELEIDAAPEAVWQFLVDPDKATRWMGQAASFDLRPGGVYRVEVLPDNVAVGEFVELDPPRRLVFSWGWEAGAGSPLAPGSSIVEFELIPVGEGTRLRFSHRGLPSVEAVEKHAHGWNHYLGRLAAAAGGEDVGPDPWLTESPA
jgi:uncharacterized protein YndB with AHSA1/START domain